MSLCPENYTAHCWGAVGALAFLHRPTGSGKAEGFSPELAGGTCFMAFRPGNRTAHCRGAVGAQALPHHAVGNGSHAIKEKSGGS